jgi:hypothetical protein
MPSSSKSRARIDDGMGIIETKQTVFGAASSPSEASESSQSQSQVNPLVDYSSGLKYASNDGESEGAPVVNLLLLRKMRRSILLKDRRLKKKYGKDNTEMRPVVDLVYALGILNYPLFMAGGSPDIVHGGRADQGSKRGEGSDMDDHVDDIGSVMIRSLVAILPSISSAEYAALLLGLKGCRWEPFKDFDFDQCALMIRGRSSVRSGGFADVNHVYSRADSEEDLAHLIYELVNQRGVVALNLAGGEDSAHILCSSVLALSGLGFGFDCDRMSIRFARQVANQVTRYVEL